MSFKEFDFLVDASMSNKIHFEAKLTILRRGKACGC